jgi:hypothetical protein
VQRGRRSVGGVALGIALVAATTLSACGGGGGQLAEQGGSGSPTTSASRTVEPVPTDELHVPRSARATARELGDVETALRGDDRDPATLADLGRRQQRAYRALAAHPSWVAAVLAQVPREVRAAVRANIAADTALASLTGSGRGSSRLPDWTVLPPQRASTLRAAYHEAETATRIPWAYLAAVHLVETRMGRIHGNSSAGAQGPMQFIPTTWAEYGSGDITNDHDAIQAAARLLAARGGPEDMDRALRGYNNDERYVTAVEAYAQVMLSDPRAYAGYHAWQVFFATDRGTVLLPEGFGTPEGRPGVAAPVATAG